MIYFLKDVLRLCKFTFAFFIRYCGLVVMHVACSIDNHMLLSFDFYIPKSFYLKEAEIYSFLRALRIFFQKKENLDSLGALKIKSISDPLRIKRKKKTDQRGLTPLGDALTT